MRYIMRVSDNKLFAWTPTLAKKFPEFREPEYGEVEAIREDQAKVKKKKREQMSVNPEKFKRDKPIPKNDVPDDTPVPEYPPIPKEDAAKDVPEPKSASEKLVADPAPPRVGKKKSDHIAATNAENLDV